MTVKRKDLVDIADKDYQQRGNEFMQCQECGFDWGGTRGDYFQMDMDEVFQCGECGSKDIALVKHNVVAMVLQSMDNTNKQQHIDDDLDMCIFNGHIGECRTCPDTVDINNPCFVADEHFTELS